jgi:hypothetical protein
VVGVGATSLRPIRISQCVCVFLREPIKKLDCGRTELSVTRSLYGWYLALNARARDAGSMEVACVRVRRRDTLACAGCHAWFVRSRGTRPALLPSERSTDEGMTNGPSIFAYLVFGPGRVSHERLSRPIKAVAWRGPGAILGAQARFREVQVRLVLG